MIYLDTSFLTPLFRAEPLSGRISNFLAAVPPGTLAISLWTRVEFASVMARDVRMKSLSEATARKLIEEFDALAVDSLHVLIPAAADYYLARDFVAEFATRLRGPDALHMAIARNHGIEVILTLDEGLIFAARKLKIKAKRGIRL
ncbi:MAG: type II toxin-antitoxin system VapC family toxin [Betaproteobacteria bacterium]|nr:type II toxin-antitoxin system VapC family toxin [Betaproteobacteria bacterium]